MWVLLFVISTSASMKSGSAAVQQEFTTREKCMTAQTILLQQARDRRNYVLINTCTPK